MKSKAMKSKAMCDVLGKRMSDYSAQRTAQFVWINLYEYIQVRISFRIFALFFNISNRVEESICERPRE
jgi:hypothetical protein